MASSLTRRGKILVVVIGVLVAAAVIVAGVYTAFWSDVTPPKGDKQGASTAQQTSVPPLSAKRAAELEDLLSNSNPKQHAAAWAEMMRDDVAAVIKDQDTYKLQVNTFNNKDTSGKKSVSGAVSATIDGTPGIISLVYIEDDNTTKPDGTWFVWKIEVN